MILLKQKQPVLYTFADVRERALSAPSRQRLGYSSVISAERRLRLGCLGACSVVSAALSVDSANPGLGVGNSSVVSVILGGSSAVPRTTVGKKNVFTRIIVGSLSADPRCFLGALGRVSAESRHALSGRGFSARFYRRRGGWTVGALGGASSAHYDRALTITSITSITGV